AVLLVACGGGESEPAVSVETPAETSQQPPAQEVVEEAPAEPATLPPPVVVTEGDAPAADEAPAEEPQAPAGPQAVFPWPTDRFGYGVQSHAKIGDPGYTMEVVKNQLGMDWVKAQMEWWLVQPSPEDWQWFFYDGVVEQANEKGVNLMFSIVGAPEWTRAQNNTIGPPDDYQNFANFLRELLNRYPGQIHAIEVWNEQNLDREWTTPSGVISPEEYVEFLRVAYTTIKEIDPNIIVISGALSPTNDAGGFVQWADDFQYMDRALAAGMLDYADCVGAHHNGYNLPPDVAFDQTGSAPKAGTATFRGPYDNPHHSWSFKTTIDTYAEKVQAVDPNMKLCVTEFGWATAEGYSEYPIGFEFAQDNTLEDQANYLVQAFEQMRTSGDVWIAYVFNFDFGNKGGGPTDDPVPYSIVDTNGVPRPAFGALADMEKIPTIGGQ
ncbi:MAG: hypothetical protein KDD89_11255, partial [Anaerolineales bacterium]|nr:hypothetical protein [Anaerolineales bacterium]